MRCQSEQIGMTDENKEKIKLILERLCDVGSITINVNGGSGSSTIAMFATLEAGSPGKNINIFSILAQSFGDDVEFIVNLRFKRPSGSSGTPPRPPNAIGYTPLRGVKIDPAMFQCESTLDILPKDLGPSAFWEELIKSGNRVEVVIVARIKTSTSLTGELEVPSPPAQRVPAFQLGVGNMDLPVLAGSGSEINEQNSPLSDGAGVGTVSFAQKVLEKRAYSDLVIVARSGAQIRAHKSFISVCSKTLEAMLESAMEESQTCRINMNDLSKEGVEAFLRFIYVEDMKQAKENTAVAFELFYAGHKYDVQRLEAEMKSLLVEKKNEEFDVAVAFKMYMFTRNIETARELKTKALQVIKGNMKELESLEEYNQLFEMSSNSKIAKELCKDLAETY